MAVPVLLDTERLTSYTVAVADTGPYAVGFDIYADGDDYENFIEVWLDGEQQTGNWSLSSNSGADLSILRRPITDATIEFTSAITGDLIILGARRPRRTTIFTPGAAIPADKLNQTDNDIVAMLRELWDLRSRLFMTIPGETGSTIAGDITGVIVGPSPSVDGELAMWSGTSGAALANSGLAAAALIALINPTIQIVTGSTDTIASGTDILIVNRSNPSTTGLTMPDASARNKRKLAVVDFSQSVTDHTITLTPASAGQKIMRATTFPMRSNASSLAARTLTPIVDPDDGSNYVWIYAP